MNIIEEEFTDFFISSETRYDELPKTIIGISDIIKNNNILIENIKSIKQELIKIFEDKKIFINIYKELLNLYINKNNYVKIEDVFKQIKPISKNTDIYAISKLIYDILINLSINDNTKKLIEKLYDDAKYYKIENPIVLNKRLEAIIKLVK